MTTDTKPLHRPGESGLVMYLSDNAAKNRAAIVNTLENVLRDAKAGEYDHSDYIKVIFRAKLP